MPVAERDRAVFRSIIDTKSKFINYLSFMLSDDTDLYIAENNHLEKELSSSNESYKDDALSTSLYEDMVRMAYSCPERISAIRQVIEKADKKVLPENFKEMYEQFEIAIKKIKRYER
jgi:cell fate regulator YaaT (PSP1 superfamily)